MAFDHINSIVLDQPFRKKSRVPCKPLVRKVSAPQTLDLIPNGALANFAILFNRVAGTDAMYDEPTVMASLARKAGTLPPFSDYVDGFAPFRHQRRDIGNIGSDPACWIGCERVFAADYQVLHVLSITATRGRTTETLTSLVPRYHNVPLTAGRPANYKPREAHFARSATCHRVGLLVRLVALQNGRV